jgi:hypothetical protein
MITATITKVLLLLLAVLALGVSGEDKLRGRRPAEQTERKIQACDKDPRANLSQGEDTRPGGSGGGKLSCCCCCVYSYHLRLFFVDVDSFLLPDFVNIRYLLIHSLLLSLVSCKMCGAAKETGACRPSWYCTASASGTDRG